MRRSQLLVRAAVAAWVVAAASTVSAVTYWQGTSGAWGKPDNWTAGVPTSDTTAVVSNGGSANIWDGDATCLELVLGAAPITRGTVHLRMATLTAGSEMIGQGGMGTFIQDGGTHTIFGNVTLGSSVGGQGEYRLDEGTLSAATEVIGALGTGSFVQTGGVNRTQGLQLSNHFINYSRGTYEISGGTLDVSTGTIHIGNWEFGSAEFVLNGGEVIADEFHRDVTGSFSANGQGMLAVNKLNGFNYSGFNVRQLRIGHSRGSGSGTLELFEGQSLAGPGVLVVGYDATATFTQTGGLNTVGTKLIVGDQVDGDGRYLLSGGHVNTPEAVIGRAGTGFVSQSGGKHDVAGRLCLGAEPDSVGVYRLFGGQLKVGGDLRVGDGGQGQLELHTATLIADTLTLGSNGSFLGDGTGTLYVNRLAGFGDAIDVPAFVLAIGHSRGSSYGEFSLGQGQVLRGPQALWVGVDAPGTFTQTGGTNIRTSLSLGEEGSGFGTYWLSGGSLLTSSTEVGYRGRGVFQHSGGNHSVSGKLTIGTEPQSSGEYDMSGGELNVYGSIVVGAGQGPQGVGKFSFNGGLVRADEITMGPRGNADGNGLATLVVNRINGQWGSLGSLVDTLKIGHSFGWGHGTYTLTDDQGVWDPRHLVVGSDAVGLFHQVGGILSADDLTLGETESGRGTYQLDAGRLEVDYAHIGLRGGGRFDQIGGINVVRYVVEIGCRPGSQGTYNMWGGDLRVYGRIGLDYLGSGEFNLHGGTVMADEVVVGTGFSADGGTLFVNRLTMARPHVELGCLLHLGYPFGATSAELTLDDEVEVQSLVASGGFTVGFLAPAQVTQNGGSVQTPDLAVYDGSRYEVRRGDLTARVESIGRAPAGGDIEGVFLQTGGTNTSRSLGIWHGAYSQYGGTNKTQYLFIGGDNLTGRYALLGGSLTMAHWAGTDLGEEIGMHVFGVGVFAIGDLNGTGTVLQEEGTGRNASLRVRITEPPSSGEFSGWGSVVLRGTLENSGRVVADGYGLDGRVLDLSSFESVTHDPSLATSQGDNTLAGWYAERRGALKLPEIALAAGDFTFTWGEDPDGPLHLVNSLQGILWDVRVQASTAAMAVSLLARDHANVSDLADLAVSGVWEFEFPLWATFTSAGVAFRYDTRWAQQMGLPEQDLRVYQHTGSGWVDVTSSINTADHLIYAEGLGGLSPFAVGAVLESVRNASSGSWHDLATWSPLGPVPTTHLRAVVGSHTVTVNGDADAFSLRIDDPAGTLTIDPGKTLSIVEGVNVPVGTLDVRGSLQAPSLEMAGGKLAVAPPGSVDVDSLRFEAGSQYLCQLDASGNGRIAADLAVINPGATLTLRALGNLGDLSLRQWGDKTRSVLTAQRGIKGGFSSQPAPGEHLGYGVFFRGAAYGGQAVDVHLFQAAPGDTDGDWRVADNDVSAMQELYAGGPTPLAGWQTGDFDANGRVDFNDAWDMLGLYDQGDYSEWSPQEPAGSEVTVRYHPTTGNISVSTSSLEDLRGIKLESKSGIFTGHEPLWPENSLFNESTPWLVGTAALPPFSAGYLGAMDLGRIARPGLDSDFLLGDLTVLYTTGSGVNITGRLEMVPEPASVVLLAVGGLGLVWYCRGPGRKRPAAPASRQATADRAAIAL